MSKQNIEQQKDISFWESNKLEKLVQQQGVKPIVNLEELSSKWPVDDDPDLLLEFILQERTAEQQTNNKEIS